MFCTGVTIKRVLTRSICFWVRWQTTRPIWLPKAVKLLETVTVCGRILSAWHAGIFTDFDYTLSESRAEIVMVCEPILRSVQPVSVAATQS